MGGATIFRHALLAAVSLILAGCCGAAEDFINAVYDAGSLSSEPEPLPPPPVFPGLDDLGGGGGDTVSGGRAGGPEGVFTAIEARGFVTCGLRTDETLSCWSAGGSSIEAAQGQFAAMGSGEANVCGIRHDGAIVCPQKLIIDRDLPTDLSEIPADGPFTQVAGGRGFLCGLRQDGGVSCRGKRTADVPPGLAGSFRQVVAGDRFVCGLTVDGSVSCYSSDALSKVWLKGRPYVQLAAGRSVLCGVKADGSVTCSDDELRIHRPEAPLKLRSVAVGELQRCGVVDQGDLSCWGTSPVGSPPPGPYRSVAPSSASTCALRESGTITCWGGAFGAAPGATPQEPAGPVDVEVTSIAIDVHRLQEGVHGVAVVVRCRAKGGTRERGVGLDARLETAQGLPVPAKVRNSYSMGFSYDGTMVRPLYVPSEGSSVVTAFLPFYAMDLPAGPQKLHVKISAREAPANPYEPPPPEVKVLGQTESDVSFVKPPVKTVEIDVSQIEVQRDAYDASLLRARKARPDLMWELHFGPRFTGTVFRSRARDDAYSATWSAGSGPFTFSEGDRLTLSVLDEDVANDDLIASFSYSLDELARQAADKTPLKRGKLLKLEFRSIQIR